MYDFVRNFCPLAKVADRKTYVPRKVLLVPPSITQLYHFEICTKLQLLLNIKSHFKRDIAKVWFTLGWVGDTALSKNQKKSNMKPQIFTKIVPFQPQNHLITVLVKKLPHNHTKGGRLKQPRTLIGDSKTFPSPKIREINLEP